MLCYFEFLEVPVLRPPLHSATPMEGRLVSAMIEVFRGTILLTHQSRFVQFLYFYLASLRPNWTEAVLSCCVSRRRHSPRRWTQQVARRHCSSCCRRVAEMRHSRSRSHRFCRAHA